VLADAVSSGAGASIVVLVIGFYVVVVFGPLAFLIVALIDIVRRPDWQWKIAGQEKVLWILLVILLNLLAIPSFIYWFNIRKKLIAVERAAAAGQFGPGHLTYTGWAPGPPVMFAGAAPPSWQPDPSGQQRWRWWDGRQWTVHATNGDAGPSGAPGPPVPGPPAPGL
jgi:hypothetical protein